MLNLLSIFSILIVLLGALWFISKKVKGSSLNSLKRSRHIKMIDEGVQTGMGQKLSIVKIDKEYFAYSYGQSGVAFHKLDVTTIETDHQVWEKEIMGEEHIESFEKLGEVLRNES